MSQLRTESHRWRLPSSLGLPAALLLCAWVTIFPPKTHEYMTTEILESVVTGKVTIDGYDYVIDERLRRAISEHPAYYRAGAIGPDAFPDIAFGQAYIHPNARCADDAAASDACAQKGGRTYTWEWLDHVYRRGWSYYDSLGGNAEGQKALAFAYGFLTHAAGDVWGHTLVNAVSGGVYPPLDQVAKNPSARLIAIRHIVADEYIGTKTVHTDMPIAVPHDFIYKTFITDTAARRMGEGYLFARFMKLRDHLQAEKDAVPRSAPRGCISVHSPAGKCLQWVARGPIIAYLDDWIWSIDRGLREWPHMSEDVAVDLLKYHSFSKAKDRLSEFATDRLPRMVAGPPGGVARILDEVGDEVWKGMPEVKIGPVEDFESELFRQAFGLSPRELESYMTTPERMLADSALRFPANTRTTLDSLMVLQPDSTFSPSRFAAYRNAIVLAKLLLLAPDELDRMQARYEVGWVYNVSDASRLMNAILGWPRSLDADHQWRRGAAVAGRATEGMPLWRNCQARERLFRRLFIDWEHTKPFPDGDDPCEAAPGADRVARSGGGAR